MSLRYWLTFNGTTENRAITPITYSKEQNVSYSGCSLVMSSTVLTFSTESINTANGVTIAFWFMPTEIKAWSDVFSINSHYHRFEISTTKTHYMYSQDDSGGGYLIPANTSLGDYELNTWYHVSIICNGSKTQLWVNGTKRGEYTPKNFTISTVTVAARGSNNNCYAGQLRDFRIYDEAISYKERIELEKGLVCHYPLQYTYPVNTSIYPPATLLTNNPAVYSNWTAESCSVSAGDETGEVKMTITNYNTNVRIYNATTNVWVKGYKYYVIYDARTGGENTTVTVSMSRSLGDFTGNESINGSWRTYSGIITSTVTVAGGTLSFRANASTKSATVYIRNVRLYRCDGMAIKEVSGFGQDTSTTGPLTELTDDVMGPYVAFGGSRAPTFTFPFPTGTTFREFTTAGWFKAYHHNDTASNLISIGQNSFWRVRLASNTAIWFYCIVGSTVCYSTIDGVKQLVNNQWHHYALTFINGNFTVYIDGQVLGVASFTAKGSVVTCNANSAAIGGYSATAEWFNGGLRDVRVYTKCLETEQVAALYKAGLEISDNGTVYSHNIVEHSGSTMKIDGKRLMPAGANEVKMSHDGKLYTEPDGTMWIRIVRQNNPASNLFASGDAFTTTVYKNSGNSWFSASACNYVNKWELMVKQKQTSTSAEKKYRWVQTKNPMTCAFGDVDAADVRFVTGGTYSTAGSSYGGLYLKNSSTYLCANNAATSNWWGAVGAWANYRGGIPAYNEELVTTGYSDLYLRIDNVTGVENIISNLAPKATTASIGSDGTIRARNIIEK